MIHIQPAKRQRVYNRRKTKYTMAKRFKVVNIAENFETLKISEVLNSHEAAIDNIYSDWISNYNGRIMERDSILFQDDTLAQPKRFMMFPDKGIYEEMDIKLIAAKRKKKKA